jgi:membrane protein implicated in regulation of membrane protease activity
VRSRRADLAVIGLLAVVAAVAAIRRPGEMARALSLDTPLGIVVNAAIVAALVFYLARRWRRRR